MEEEYCLQKAVPTVREGSEWTCLGWSCPNKVAKYYFAVLSKTAIYYPGNCEKPEGPSQEKSEKRNRSPVDDSFSESSVSRYGWEGREVEQNWDAPDWKSMGRETSQPWLPVRGIQNKSHCSF